MRIKEAKNQNGTAYVSSGMISASDDKMQFQFLKAYCFWIFQDNFAHFHQ
jgi:hypothetical protein